jgi:hypothetical protein
VISRERIEAYRRMTPAERWAETLVLLDYGWEMLLRLPREERERRLEAARLERQRINDRVARELV